MLELIGLVALGFGIKAVVDGLKNSGNSDMGNTSVNNSSTNRLTEIEVSENEYWEILRKYAKKYQHIQGDLSADIWQEIQKETKKGLYQVKQDYFKAKSQVKKETSNFNKDYSKTNEENYGYSSSYSFLSNSNKSSGRVIYSKISGVTMGANRQLYASRCYKGQELELVREKTNPYDSNAIAIYAGNNQLGYVKRDLAETLAKELDKGNTFKCTVEEVTGGSDKNYGVNIKLQEIK